MGSCADSKYFASGHTRTVVPCRRSPAARGRANRGSATSPAAKGQARDLALAVRGHLQPGRERIRHRHAHAVQAAREAVGAALPLVELAARVQAREHQLDHRRAFLGVQAEGNAAAVVLHADRAVLVQRDLDLLAVARQRLVGGVVQHLLDDVQGVVGAGVHARALLDGLQALKNADRALGIRGC
ncbi:hypothetical protein ALISP_6792 [Alicycliphilus sp. B1]|nr:hypothetical protein ALISP_6792 [Alicycliphilus sp. B1]